MHMLHKILVPLSERELNSLSHEDLIDEARSTAEDDTENYYDTVFDWRETVTAGRWEIDYPVNVMLSRDDLSRFIKELEETREYQDAEISRYLKEICKTSSDLREICSAIDEPGSSWQLSYNLQVLAEMLAGVYTFESGFYHVDTASSRVTQGLIEQVRATPNKWALVMFDYHI